MAGQGGRRCGASPKEATLAGTSVDIPGEQLAGCLAVTGHDRVVDADVLFVDMVRFFEVGVINHGARYDALPDGQQVPIAAGFDDDLVEAYVVMDEFVRIAIGLEIIHPDEDFIEPGQDLLIKAVESTLERIQAQSCGACPRRRNE